MAGRGPVLMSTFFFLFFRTEELESQRWSSEATGVSQGKGTYPSYSHWRTQGTQLIQAERPSGRSLSGSRSGTSTKQERDFRPKKGQEHGRRKEGKRSFIFFKIFFDMHHFFLVFIASVAILFLFYVLVGS